MNRFIIMIGIFVVNFGLSTIVHAANNDDKLLGLKQIKTQPSMTSKTAPAKGAVKSKESSKLKKGGGEQDKLKAKQLKPKQGRDDLKKGSRSQPKLKTDQRKVKMRGLKRHGKQIAPSQMKNQTKPPAR